MNVSQKFSVYLSPKAVPKRLDKSVFMRYNSSGVKKKALQAA